MAVVFAVSCPIKLNLTLRVLNKRSDGYHEIRSLFWRLRSPESLEAFFGSEKDGLSVFGDDIPGENLVIRAIRHIRNMCGDDALPPVNLRLYKRIPMGSGLGAGSGNAAAMIGLFRRICGGAKDAAVNLVSVGADVAFLAGDHEVALARGRGEVLEGLNGRPKAVVALFFPHWKSDTRHAYDMLDEAREGSVECIISDSEARDEAVSVLGLLKDGRRVGLLPNDFFCCVGHEREYGEIADLADESGALAWGLCGSGSAYFVLFNPEDSAGLRSMLASLAALGAVKDRFQWLRKILVLE
ncbi:MAG: 4-diphosphocytidyl-2C-methyl-D-erythritol kinase [Synergistaceae bacterium]|jgi:4-diphosphocytidyl-2-C-methyl-D-erythritol kinase|nr:4-diphosphocytidyl-2C-methyl-D-erythritol kinase [Synergistaceae bacterium]